MATKWREPGIWVAMAMGLSILGVMFFGWNDPVVTQEADCGNVKVAAADNLCKPAVATP
ncbi:hypothetical protein [Mesorhizobium sp. DCY119]|uniref:hypothetical protein n=1 Tax=Mesorhizobium sp. DCY119 TaxID=2108445 RepID=UPI0013C490CC|nr:hypothetical protein [Mesorhizobium sp. DCY119]